MRQLRRFDFRQLIITTEAGSDLARRYTGVLRRAGYVIRQGKRLVLCRDTGPKPPLVLRHKEPGKWFPIGILDRNTGECFGLDGQAPPSLPRRHVRETAKPGRRSVWTHHPEAAAEIRRMTRKVITTRKLHQELRRRVPALDMSLRTLQRHLADLRRQGEKLGYLR